MRHLLVAVLILVAAVSVARAQDFSVGEYNTFYTRLDARKQPVWQSTVQKALVERGFDPKQATKLAKLKMFFEESKTRGVFSIEGLPMRFNSETGEKLPADPLKYAAALPDCLKIDDRNCDMKFSPNAGVNMPGAKLSDENYDIDFQPCLLPERTKQYCKRVGYKERKTDNGRGLSCGEGERIGSECGADQLVFDAGAETTKLKLTFDADEKKAATVSEAVSPLPVVKKFPSIVYAMIKNGDGNFKRRGPKDFEEWEPTKADLDCSAITTDKKCIKIQKESRAFRYCWPHDVARLSACVIP